MLHDSLCKWYLIALSFFTLNWLKYQITQHYNFSRKFCTPRNQLLLHLTSTICTTKLHVWTPLNKLCNPMDVQLIKRVYFNISTNLLRNTISIFFLLFKIIYIFDSNECTTKLHVWIPLKKPHSQMCAKLAKGLLTHNYQVMCF